MYSTEYNVQYRVHCTYCTLDVGKYRELDTIVDRVCKCARTS